MSDLEYRVRLDTVSEYPEIVNVSNVNSPPPEWFFPRVIGGSVHRVSVSGAPALEEAERRLQERVQFLVGIIRDVTIRAASFSEDYDKRQAELDAVYEAECEAYFSVNIIRRILFGIPPGPRPRACSSLLARARGELHAWGREYMALSLALKAIQRTDKKYGTFTEHRKGAAPYVYTLMSSRSSVLSIHPLNGEQNV